jgi:hypothetical protein
MAFGGEYWSWVVYMDFIISWIVLYKASALCWFCPEELRLCIYVGFGINLGFQLESNLWVVAGNLMVLCRLFFLVFFFSQFILHSNYPKKIYAFMVLSSVVQAPWSVLVPVWKNWPDWYRLSLIPNACLVMQGHEVMLALYQYICAKINTRPRLVLSCPIFCVNLPHGSDELLVLYYII